MCLGTWHVSVWARNRNAKAARRPSPRVILPQLARNSPHKGVLPSSHFRGKSGNGRAPNRPSDGAWSTEIPWGRDHHQRGSDNLGRSPYGVSFCLSQAMIEPQSARGWAEPRDQQGAWEQRARLTTNQAPDQPPTFRKRQRSGNVVECWRHRLPEIAWTCLQKLGPRPPASRAGQFEGWAGLVGGLPGSAMSEFRRLGWGQKQRAIIVLEMMKRIPPSSGPKTHHPQLRIAAQCHMCGVASL